MFPSVCHDWQNIAVWLLCRSEVPCPYLHKEANLPLSSIEIEVTMTTAGWCEVTCVLVSSWEHVCSAGISYHYHLKSSHSINIILFWTGIIITPTLWRLVVDLSDSEMKHSWTLRSLKLLDIILCFGVIGMLVKLVVMHLMMILDYIWTNVILQGLWCFVGHWKAITLL